MITDQKAYVNDRQYEIGLLEGTVRRLLDGQHAIGPATNACFVIFRSKRQPSNTFVLYGDQVNGDKPVLVSRDYEHVRLVSWAALHDYYTLEA